MTLSREQIDKLTLFRSHHVGPIIYKKLMQKYGSARAALDDFEFLNKTYNKRLKIADPKKIQAEISALYNAGGKFVFIEDDAFPTPLKFTEDCPPLLSVLGNAECLNKEHIAIVGNRNASAPSLKLTQKIAGELSENNLGVISGLARGIDTSAHQGALAKNGVTIAVLAGGVNHIYPPENKKLYEEIIAKGGAIISEMPWGVKPTQNHFPRRNRIVSGISLGVAVIECPKRSGSLITARLALEQNREVFAVPGSPTDPRAEGPNYLIRGGAHMLTDVEDILKNRTKWMETMLELPLTSNPSKMEIAEKIKHIEPEKAEEAAAEFCLEDTAKENSQLSHKDIILNLLSSATPTEADVLIRELSINDAEATALLSEMELDGDIDRISGGYIRA